MIINLFKIQILILFTFFIVDFFILKNKKTSYYYLLVVSLLILLIVIINSYYEPLTPIAGSKKIPSVALIWLTVDLYLREMDFVFWETAIEIYFYFDIYAVIALSTSLPILVIVFLNTDKKNIYKNLNNIFKFKLDREIIFALIIGIFIFVFFFYNDISKGKSLNFRLDVFPLNFWIVISNVIDILFYPYLFFILSKNKLSYYLICIFKISIIFYSYRILYNNFEDSLIPTIFPIFFIMFLIMLLPGFNKDKNYILIKAPKIFLILYLAAILIFICLFNLDLLYTSSP